MSQKSMAIFHRNKFVLTLASHWPQQPLLKIAQIGGSVAVVINSDRSDDRYPDDRTMLSLRTRKYAETTEL
ncbi:hypothetical protein B5P45_02985 [Phyllobacterium zundukense]|uniref:Uncharacterized protein n=1 Tax=Phyllobacterium zundukense TaxID=1867719 RepID=A0A2N9W4W0_9HYPH|nr:hypothetical protein BLM14_09090 [Phyllobacterium zundukense]PIO46778.1 hypothetical protein B5P45_02985 [Phyllobacterium zundukense]